MTSRRPGLDQVPLTAVPLLPGVPPVSLRISAEPEPTTRALDVVRPSLRLRYTVLYGTSCTTTLATRTGGPPATCRQLWARASKLQTWVACPGAVIRRVEVRHAPVLAKLAASPTPDPWYVNSCGGAVSRAACWTWPVDTVGPEAAGWYSEGWLAKPTSTAAD